MISGVAPILNFNKVRVIIYDCDGVLCDSTKANLKFYNHILKEFGKPPINEGNQKLVNIAQTRTTKEVLEVIFLGDPTLEEAQKFSRETNYDPFHKWMNLEPGIPEILEILQNKYILSIATNRGKSLVKVLTHFNLNRFFDYWVTSLDVNAPKPHPDYLLKIIRHFNIAKEEALYIGDSRVDRETSREAGVNFIAYKNNLDTPMEIHNHLELRSMLGI